uniref:SGNH hydrolase-type esterase domain-containing protein n=1 Tax=Stegastes partitus TaxID=144197 RepID=A0A3B5ABG5_9TELE
TTAPAAAASPSVLDSSVGLASHSTGKPNERPPSRSHNASSRRRLLREAVMRHSGSLPCSSPISATVSPLQPASSSPNLHPPSSPRPLFSPTTLIVGDSFTRNIRFFNAVTHCLPGATVSIILDKLPGLLRSLPPSVHRVIVHVGSNDTARQQSELTKKDFNELLKALSNCGKSVFISGPVPTLGRGVGRFSRILSLNTFLPSACRAHNVGFIDNFNLFWNRSSFFRPDGVHPNKLGSRILAANLLYTVQSSPRD